MCSKPLFKVMCRRDELGHAYLRLCHELGMEWDGKSAPGLGSGSQEKIWGSFKVWYYTHVTLHHAVLLQEPFPNAFFGGHINCRYDKMLTKV